MLRKKMLAVTTHKIATEAQDDLNSKYFSDQEETCTPLALQFLDIQRNLNTHLNQVNFLKNPITYIYNPTEYAADPNILYIKRYCQTTKNILLVGMNPGPYGMCQTGVPFGDTNWVKNWLKIQGTVTKPLPECPNKPVLGFKCTRKEQSGDRFWKFWSEVSITPNSFFKNSFVYNYCPLAFFDVGGRNLTPADIKDRKELEKICDKYYLEIINLLQPEIIIAIGTYIHTRTKSVFKTNNIQKQLLCLPHPSPRAVGNQNWPEKAKKFIEDNNLVQYFQ